MTAPEQLDLIGRHIDLEVDGMPAGVSCAIVTMLGCIVRNGLASGFKRAF